MKKLWGSAAVLLALVAVVITLVRFDADSKKSVPPTNACGDFLAVNPEKMPRGTPDAPFNLTKIDCGEFGTLYDSGSGLMSSDSSFVWISNRKVVFRGINGRPDPANTLKNWKDASYSRLYLWDIDQGVSEYKPYKHLRSNYCISPKRSRFVVSIYSDTGEFLGNEAIEVVGNVETRTRLKNVDYKTTLWNEFSCQFEERPSRKSKHPHWTRLAEEHGYLAMSGVLQETWDAYR